MRPTRDGVGKALRHARRRRSHLALACVVAGLALTPAGVPVVAAFAVAAAAAGALTFGGRGALVAATLVTGAACLASTRIDALDRPARAAPPGTVIDATATVLEAPRRTHFGSAAPLEVEDGPARGLRVLARVNDGGWPAGVSPGMRVHMRALVRDPRGAAGPGTGGASEANAGAPGTPGYGPLPPASDGFDYAAFLRTRRIGRQVSVESMRAVGRRGGVSGVVDSIRSRADRAISAGLPPQQAALARGMVLGQDGDLADDVRDDFQRSGLAHLTAASGQNVMLLCALALPLLMVARAGPRTRIAVLLAVVALYVPLAGAGASVTRAGVMAAAALVAMAAGRPSSAPYALLLAAACTLGLNPRASGDPGWQLSFAAVGGMLLLGPRVRGLLRGLPRPAAEGIGATIAATISTAPVMAHQFGAISLAALPANIAALPAVAPVMWIGMADAALAQAAALGRVPAAAADVLCRLANRASGLGVGWVAGVARRFADAGWAQAGLHLSWLGVVLGYATIAATVGVGVMAPRLARAALAPGAPPLRERLLELLDNWRAMPRRSRRRAVALAGVLAFLAVASAALPPRPPDRLTVDYLDIGQGDATLVRDPYGAAVLFDGGPPEARVDRLLRRLGVRRLSVVVATHQSRDHHGGLLAVVKRFPVGLFLDGGDGTRDPTFIALEREVDRRRIRRVAVRRGQLLHIGAMTIRILSPGPRPPGPPPSDPNPRATVAIVSEGGFDLFLSADAESGPLLSLALPPVEAIKVPHHGSADPGLPQLLERMRPRVAAIEVGRGNVYGHPRRSTLDALRAHVPNVYRTDRDGTVELTVDRGQMTVRTHR